MVYPYHEILLSNKKEQNVVKCNNLEESVEKNLE